MIENPNYFNEEAPFSTATPIQAMGLELWAMSNEIYFDNFHISNSDLSAQAFGAQTFHKKVAHVKALEPSILEKAEKATKENPWIKWVVCAILVIPALWIAFRKMFPKKPVVIEEFKEEDSTIPEEEELPETRDSQEDDTVASDDEKEDSGEESDSVDEQAAGDADEAEEKAEEIESDSDDDEPTVDTSGPRKRRTAKRAD